MQHHSSQLARLIMMTSLILGLIVPTATYAAAGSNDMMCGGASTPAQFAHKLDYGDACSHSAAELRGIYLAINPDVTAKNIMNGNTTYGTVTKSGEVIVGGKVVATGALSYGRTNLAGSHPVGSASDPLYGRPPTDSFAADSLPAMVHIAGGTFRYAIVESCGNLVTATPTPIAAPVRPAAVAPVPAAPTTVNVTQVQYQTQTQTQVVAPVRTVAIPTSAPAPQPVALATPLPKTGATGGFAGLSLLLTAAWYWRRSRRGLHSALRLPSL